jgi:hypothetical protein
VHRVTDAGCAYGFPAEGDRMSYDAVIIGAGHNGLAAGTGAGSGRLLGKMLRGS